jgi:hypothetical protein
LLDASTGNSRNSPPGMTHNLELSLLLQLMSTSDVVGTLSVHVPSGVAVRQRVSLNETVVATLAALGWGTRSAP